MAAQLAGRVDPFLLRDAAARAASLTRGRGDEIARCKAIAGQLRAELSAPQLALHIDPSPRAAALCSRQAGKTFDCVHDLLDTALTRQGGYSIYVNTSKDECRNIVWDNPDQGVGLLATIERLKIPCETNDTRMSVRIPATGSRIKLIGIDDKAEVKKIRGPAYDLVIIDEAQGIPYLQALAVDAAEPGIVKRRGRVRVVGTPGEVCDGLFYEITRDDGGALKGWSVHRWTILENPGIPHAEEYLAALMREKGWTEDNETFQREYRGRWVTASSLLVYRLTAVAETLRYHDGLPVGNYDWRFLVGIDLGFYPDPFAVVVWAYCDDLPSLFEVESESFESLNTEQQAGILAGLVEKYQPERMVGDAGSGGLKQIIVGDWQQRYGLPVDVAQKEHKDSAIDAFNADLVAGRIKLRRDSALDKQMRVLPWKNQIGAKRVEDVRRNKGNFHNDLCDAGLYAYRESAFYEGRPRPQRPALGTPERINLDVSEEKARLISRVQEGPLSLYDLADDGGSEWRRWGR